MRLSFKFIAVFVMLLSIWLRPVIASSTLSESRINQLEFQVRSLQTQINQLQGRSSNSGSTSTAMSRPDFAGSPGELSLDAQFDNLATLVIEINQRLLKLEAQATAGQQ